MSLAGKTVVVTRARHQSDELVALLEQRGARPIVLPVIDIVEPDDHGDAMQLAFASIDSYDWLVVTSVNTVDRLPGVSLPPHLKIAAIGSGTAERLEARGFAVSLLPPQFVAESLLTVFPPGEGRVLLPRAAVARDVLPQGLTEKGWHVDVVDAYKTVDVVPPADLLDAALAADIVTFTAPSTVKAFMRASAGRVPSGFIACIGPVTEEAVRASGLMPAAVAAEHTIEGLVSAIS
jgi:uroporphyrinogen III methyltransferase/synthase